ncbi:hypothetical protein K1T71_015279 [Dendrolimus kikuchii]|nr:hypothetical protein K1T71_015279 [Dendrolimus kikuchii]
MLQESSRWLLEFCWALRDASFGASNVVIGWELKKPETRAGHVPEFPTPISSLFPARWKADSPDWEETMPLTRSPIGSKSSLCEESTEMYADGRTTNVPTLSRAHVAALRGNTTVGTSTETSGTVYRGTTRRTRAVTAAAAAVANAVNAAHVQELPASSALNALHVA